VDVLSVECTSRNVSIAAKVDILAEIHVCEQSESKRFEQNFTHIGAINGC